MHWIVVWRPALCVQSQMPCLRSIRGSQWYRLQCTHETSNGAMHSWYWVSSNLASSRSVIHPVSLTDYPCWIFLRNRIHPIQTTNQSTERNKELTIHIHIHYWRPINLNVGRWKWIKSFSLCLPQIFSKLEQEECLRYLISEDVHFAHHVSLHSGAWLFMAFPANFTYITPKL